MLARMHSQIQSNGEYRKFCYEKDGGDKTNISVHDNDAINFTGWATTDKRCNPILSANIIWIEADGHFHDVLSRDNVLSQVREWSNLHGLNLTSGNE